MSRWPNKKQKKTIFSRMGYKPNEAQAPIHDSKAVVLQVVGAEGAGKSQVAAAEVAANMFWSRLVYLVGQTYDNSVAEFNYLVEGFLSLGVLDTERVSQPKQGSWVMTTRSGCEIRTLSVERGAASVIAKGEQPDIIVLCEAGVINSYSVFLAVVRRARRMRGRVVLIGTLKDDFGWYASLADELAGDGNAWQGETYSLPAWTNLILYPGGRDDPEIKYLEDTMPPDEFARTVAAKKMPSQALVLPEFSYSEQVKPCPYNDELPVHLWIDPGYFPSVYAVVPVQFYGREVWQIDEVYLNYHEHGQVIDECRKREWFGNVEHLVMDVAGKQHHAQASAAEIWLSETGFRPAMQKVGIMDGVSRHRSALTGYQGVRLYHDASCTGTLGEYRQYRRPTDRDGNPTADMPKDEHNHAMKAIAYGLVDKFGFVVHEHSSPSAVVPLFELGGVYA